MIRPDERMVPHEGPAALAQRAEAADHPPWRRTLRRELTWLMTLKIAALALLWWLFFSPAHRSPVDGRAASRRFAVAASTVSAPPPAYAREERRP